MKKEKNGKITTSQLIQNHYFHWMNETHTIWLLEVSNSIGWKEKFWNETLFSIEYVHKTRNN